jgi:hypothetical protein
MQKRAAVSRRASFEQPDGAAAEAAGAVVTDDSGVVEATVADGSVALVEGLALTIDAAVTSLAAAVLAGARAGVSLVAGPAGAVLQASRRMVASASCRSMRER